jgi:ABC-type branched-subunit amino acid transport system ATPase component
MRRAGKTTFLNLVTGYLKPTSGTIRFQGRDITGMAPRRITRLGICRSFQIPQVFDTLSTYENLLVGLGIVSMGRRSFVGSQLGAGRPETIAEDMLERFHLAGYRDEPASVLPEGVRKLLDIAMALAVKPSILLLDEPTIGLDPNQIQRTDVRFLVDPVRLLGRQRQVGPDVGVQEPWHQVHRRRVVREQPGVARGAGEEQRPERLGAVARFVP